MRGNENIFISPACEGTHRKDVQQITGKANMCIHPPSLRVPGDSVELLSPGVVS